LTDLAHGQKGKIESIKRSKVLEQNRVFTAGEFCNQNEDEADIEDLIGLDLYLELVNAAYDLKGENILTPADVSKSGVNSPRIVKQVEAIWWSKPELPEFDHFFPARYLIEHPETINSTNAADAVKRFERLFQKLNLLIA